jgi:hypothetical protein
VTVERVTVGGEEIEEIVGHGVWLLTKEGPSSWRSLGMARWRWDFTVPWLIRRAVATSVSERSAM